MNCYLFTQWPSKTRSHCGLSVDEGVCLFAQVQKHLSKLFDNMAKMRFEEDEEGNPTKMGLGMYSKEEEYVPFNQSCDCTGQVIHTCGLCSQRFTGPR